MSRNVFLVTKRTVKNILHFIFMMYMNAYIFYIDYIVYIYSDICQVYWWLASRPVVTHESLVHCQLFCKGNWTLRPVAFCCMALGCADCVGHKTRKYQKNTAINTVDTQHAADLLAFFYYLFYYVFIFIVFLLLLHLHLSRSPSLSLSLRKSFRLHFRQ